MQSTAETEPPASSAAELLAQYPSSQPQQARSAPRSPETAQLANLMQQQGIPSQTLNLNDPNIQNHVIALLQQFNPQFYQTQSQQAPGQNLDALLQQISRHPELAASLPTLLNSLTGSLGGQAHLPKLEGGQADVQSSFSAQLYGAPNAGMGEGELKADSADGLVDLDQDPKLGSVKCAKEKNRQAQRRFRERQKGLIQNLRAERDNLAKTVDEQRRQIEALEKEISVLRIVFQGKEQRLREGVGEELQ